MPTLKERTLLIDGDTLVYIAASAAQHTVEDPVGFVQPFANVREGEALVDNLILGWMRDLKAHYMQVFLSDPESNWRHELMPEYKSNRDHSTMARPLLLGRLKEYLRRAYDASHWAGLEADDVLGILATTKDLFPGEVIVVGKDKDFNTIPGLHFQIGKDKTGEVREVTQEAADFWHLVQALAGDRIDGYPGCPGIGMERAKCILAEPKVLEPEHGVVTRGPRKGQTTTKWVARDAHGDRWACLVSNYAKAFAISGITKNPEAAALLTARMARILRAGEYNRETGVVTLWVPPKWSKSNATA